MSHLKKLCEQLGELPFSKLPQINKYDFFQSHFKCFSFEYLNESGFLHFNDIEFDMIFPSFTIFNPSTDIRWFEV